MVSLNRHTPGPDGLVGILLARGVELVWEGGRFVPRPAGRLTEGELLEVMRFEAELDDFMADGCAG